MPLRRSPPGGHGAPPASRRGRRQCTARRRHTCAECRVRGAPGPSPCPRPPAGRCRRCSASTGRVRERSGPVRPGVGPRDGRCRRKRPPRSPGGRSSPRSRESSTRRSFAESAASAASPGSSFVYAASTPSSRSLRARVPRWTSSRKRSGAPGIRCGRSTACTAMLSPAPRDMGDGNFRTVHDETPDLGERNAERLDDMAERRRPVGHHGRRGGGGVLRRDEKVQLRGEADMNLRTVHAGQHAIVRTGPASAFRPVTGGEPGSGASPPTAIGRTGPVRVRKVPPGSSGAARRAPTAAAADLATYGP